MATEVGTAFVTIIPSARGFARRLQSELAGEIRKAIGGTSDREGDRAGREFGQRFSRSAGLGLRDFSKHVKSVLGAATGALKNLGIIPLLIGTAATAVAGLAAAAGAAVPALISLGSALATAGGAAAAIPGALALAGIAAGTLRLGLIGIDDAFKALAAGDAAKFGEALKGLAPSARRALVAVQKLKPAFDRLRLSTQERLFDRLGKAVQLVGRSYFPLAERAATRLAAIFNTAIRSAIDVLLDRQTRIDIGRVLNAGVTAAGNLAGAIRPITQALRDVVVVGAEVTAGLTGGIGEAIGGFAERISQLRASGGLADMINDGLAVLRQFGDLGRDVLGIVRGIMGAAGGAGGKDGPGAGLFAFFDRLNQVVNSVKGQQVLGDLFRSLGDIAVALTPVLLALAQALVPVAKGVADIAVAFAPGLQQVAEALGTALSGLAPAIVSLAPALSAIAVGLAPLGQILADLITGAAPGVTALIAGLAQALSALAPAALPVGQALARVAVALAPLLPLIGAQLANALIIIAGLISEVATAAGPLIEVFSGALLQAAQVLTPVLLTMAQIALPLIATAVTELARAIAPLVPQFVQLAQVIAQQIVKALPLLLQAFSQLLPVVLQLVPIFAQLVQEVLRELAPVLPELTQAVLDGAVAFAELLAAVAPILPPMVRMLAALLPLLTGMRTWAPLIKIVTGLIYLATASIRTMTSIIRAILSPIAGARGALSGFGSAAANAARLAVATFVALPGRIRSAVGSMGNLLVQAGRNVVQGLINGIRSMFGSLRNVASDIAGTIRSYLPFSPAKQGPLSGRGNPYYSGKAIVRLLALGVKQNMRYVEQASDAIASQFTVASSRQGVARAAMAAATAGTATFAPAPTGPIYVSAQFGMGPVYDLVEGVLITRPQAVANAAQLGGTQLARR